MSTKVDVLAVMKSDAACADLYREQSMGRGCADLLKLDSLGAIDAVAELIDAAKTIATRTDWATHFGCHFGECATCRLDAALARVGGAA